jgi:regulator of protease activity HflC (stomatin/prohibitin superfamily)
MSEALSAIKTGRSPRVSRRRVAWVIAILVALSLGSCSLFSVPQGHFGVIGQLHADVEPCIVDAGLHAKWPWQSVEKIDGRGRLTDLPAREKRTGDGETIVVHPCTVWRVEASTAAPFLSAGDEATVATRLSELIWRALDIELAASKLTDLLGPGAAEQSDNQPLTSLTDRILVRCQPPALKRLGVRLLDVRIYRLTCPERTEQQVLHRMAADRQRRIDRQFASAEARASAIMQAAEAEADQFLADAETRVRQIGQDTETQVATIIQRAGFDPGFRELVLRMEDYHRLLEENASVVISDGKFFDALFQPGPTSASQPPHDAPAPPPVGPTTRPTDR